MTSYSLRDRIRRLEERLRGDPDNVALRQELLRIHAQYLNTAEDPEDGVTTAYEINLEVLYALCPRDPSLAEVLAAQVDPRYELRPPLDRQAKEHYRTGLRVLADGDPWHAEEELRAALLEEPDAISVHAQLARLAIERLDWQVAWTHLEYALTIDPGAAPIRALAGEALRGLGRLDEAYAESIEALAINPLCSHAEWHLAGMGPDLGYRWLSLPLRPAVWPLIESDGRSWIKVADRTPAMVRGAWRRWALTVLRLCRRLPPELTPLAGLPRHLPFLLASYRALVTAWRARRWLSSRRDLSARLLDWLVAVDDDDLLPAYVFYSYLHPDLATEFQAWQRGHPDAMRRFLTAHVTVRDPRVWPEAGDS